MTGPPDGDLAQRFLAAAAARMPAVRRDWGQAMLAELDQVRGRPARWRFALGAARAALVPPRSTRLAWLAAIVLAAGACAAGAAIHALAPGAGVAAAVAVPGLPALCALAVLARPRPARRIRGAGRIVQVITVAGIAACPVLALREVSRYPAGAAGPAHDRGMTLLFAAELAGYLWLALRQPRPLAGRRSGVFGLAAALVVAGAFLLDQSGVSGTATWTAALAAPLAAGALATRYDGGPGNGIGAVLWAGLLGGPALFIVNMVLTSRAVSLEARDPQAIAFAHQQGATSVPAWITGDHIGSSIVMLTGISLLSLMLSAAWVPVGGTPAVGGSPLAGRPRR